MEKIEFDEKTKATIMDLMRTYNEIQTRINLIVETVICINGQDPSEYKLADDLSGVTKK